MHEGGHRHQGGSRPDVTEQLAMDRHDRLVVADVGDEHPGPDDIGEGEARLHERALDDPEDRSCLGAGVSRVP